MVVGAISLHAAVIPVPGDTRSEPSSGEGLCWSEVRERKDASDNSRWDESASECTLHHRFLLDCSQGTRVC